MEIEELIKICKELGLINEKQEKRVRFHQTRAQHLTMAYILCQALVFNSITQQSSLSRCTNWWIPFSISLSCSIIYFMAFLDAVSMFYQTQYQLDLNHVEQQLIHLQIHLAKTHNVQIGESVEGGKQRPQFDMLKADEIQLLKRKVYITITVSALIGFAVVMLLACRSLLCS